MSYVEMKSVVKAFGQTEVIHGIDLAVEKEEFTVFVGPSGCGKTTLLRLIAGLEELNEGAIHIGGERIDELPPSKRGIAMVFQKLRPLSSYVGLPEHVLRVASRQSQKRVHPRKG